MQHFSVCTLSESYEQNAQKWLQTRCASPTVMYRDRDWHALYASYCTGHSHTWMNVDTLCDPHMFSSFKVGEFEMCPCTQIRTAEHLLQPCQLHDALLLLLRSPCSYISGVHHFGWDFCACDRFFFCFVFVCLGFFFLGGGGGLNPFLKVVTFHLRG